MKILVGLIILSLEFGNVENNERNVKLRCRKMYVYFN